MKIINWVEKLLYEISVLDIDKLLNPSEPVFLAFLLVGLAGLFFLPLNNSLKKNLIDLGIASSGSKLKLTRSASCIEIEGINSPLMERGYWISKLEVLSNIFSLKLIDVAILGKGKIGVRLYLDTLPRRVSFVGSCPTLNPMEVWFGVNQFGENVVVNLQESSSIYIDGKPGSGKTIAITSIIKSYLKGIMADLDLIVVTTKPADYYFLRKYKTINLKLIDPFEGCLNDRALEIIEDITSLKTMEEEFKKVIECSEALESSSHNVESLRAIGKFQDFPRKLFIFDEAKDYLAKNKADTKEDRESKQKLVAAVYTQ